MLFYDVAHIVCKKSLFCLFLVATCKEERAVCFSLLMSVLCVLVMQWFRLLLWYFLVIHSPFSDILDPAQEVSYLATAQQNCGTTNLSSTRKNENVYKRDKINKI